MREFTKVVGLEVSASARTGVVDVEWEAPTVVGTGVSGMPRMMKKEAGGVMEEMGMGEEKARAVVEEVEKAVEVDVEKELLETWGDVGERLGDEKGVDAIEECLDDLEEWGLMGYGVRAV